VSQHNQTAEARRSEAIVKASDVKAGDKVTMAGFHGTVTTVCEWSRTVDGVMVEVRLPGGIGCYSCSDLRERA
jgi:hypothetical protein